MVESEKGGAPHVSSSSPLDTNTKDLQVYKGIEFCRKNDLNFIPLRPKEKTPLIDWKIFQNRKITDEEIKKYFGEGSQNNLGIVLGKTSRNLFAIDFDKEELFYKFYPTEETRKNLCLIKTGRGFHTYFFADEVVKPLKVFSAEHTEDITIKSEGGYCVGIGSIHPNGSTYELVQDNEIPTLSGNPREDIKARCIALGLSFGNAEGGSEIIDITSVLKGVVKGGRGVACMYISHYLRRQGASEDEALVILNTWRELCTPVYTEAEIKRDLRNHYTTKEAYSFKFVSNPNTHKIGKDLSIEAEAEAEAAKVIEKVDEATRTEAMELLADPELLLKINADMETRICEDNILRNLVLFTALSAQGQSPLNLVLKGPSSSGKTYVMTNALKYFPPEDVWFLGGMSPTALKHKHGDIKKIDGVDCQVVDMDGKMLAFLETPSKDTLEFLHPIMSHDVPETRYDTAEKGEKGQYETKTTIVKGHPAFGFCTAKRALLNETLTRSIYYAPGTSINKIDAVLDMQNEAATNPWGPSRNSGEFVKKIQSAMRVYKEDFKGAEVSIPDMAGAKMAKSRDPRTMRDNPKLQELIRSCARLHAYQRVCLVRTVEGVEEKLILASPFDVLVGEKMFNEIALSTTTGLPPVVIDFFNDVILPLCCIENEDQIHKKDMQKKHLEVYGRQIGESTLSKERLVPLEDTGYISKEVDQNDRRQNVFEVLSIIKPKESGEYRGLVLQDSSEQERVKEWFYNHVNNTGEIKIYVGDMLYTSSSKDLEDLYAGIYINEKIPGIISRLFPEPVSAVKEEETANSNSPVISGICRNMHREKQRTFSTQAQPNCVLPKAAKPKLKPENADSIEERWTDTNVNSIADPEYQKRLDTEAIRKMDAEEIPK